MNKVLVSALFWFACAVASPLPTNAATFTTTLLGSNEAPANASTATGTATVTLNGNILTVDETFSGLIGGVASGAHIHCCAPPGNNPAVNNAVIAVPFPFSPAVPAFPATTSGTYSNTFDLSLAATYNPVFITNNGGTVGSAEAAFILGLENGQAYANIHDATFPGGEIRGWLVATPLPAALPLFATGLGALGLLGWRRKRKAQAAV